MRSRGEIGGPRLAENLTDRVEQDRRRVRPSEGVDRRRRRLRAEDHAGSPTVRRVVDRPVPAKAPLSQVVDADGREPTLLDATRDARLEGALEHRGKERQDIDLESHAGVSGASDDGVASAASRVSGVSGVSRVSGVVALLRVRRRGAFGRSGSGARERGGRRSSESASTTISPRRGAKIRMNARTAGRSKLPNGPPSTANTSISPTR